MTCCSGSVSEAEDSLAMSYRIDLALGRTAEAGSSASSVEAASDSSEAGMGFGIGC